MNRKYQHGLALIIIPVLLVIVILLLSFVALFQYKKNATYDNNTSTTKPMNDNLTDLKTFKSSAMNFTVQIPNNYTIDEKTSTLEIIGPSGKILVGNYGTEYKNIENHVENLNYLNKNIVLQSEKTLINNLDSVMQIIEWDQSASGELKEYLILVDKTVYTFSTDNTGFYEDLDQIAHSFRYIPN